VIHVVRSRTKSFTQVSNDVLRNPELSLKAKGLLIQLLSHEDGWQQSIRYSIRECADGEASIRSALVELEAAGYLQRSRRRNSQGKFLWDHVVTDIRSDLPQVENPRVDDPHVEKPPIEEESLDVEPLGEELQDQTSRPTPEAEQLCALLADLVEANGAKRPKITETWKTEARRLLELDHRPLSEVVSVLRWATADSFWQPNILSMPKFRQKYDQLRLRMLQDNGRRPETTADRVAAAFGRSP
jgi:helix-turn-helix protein